MNGIQGFYVGGRTEIGTKKQKKSTGAGGYDKTIRERQKDNNKEKVLDASKPITLDFLTNPNKE